MGAMWCMVAGRRVMSAVAVATLLVALLPTAALGQEEAALPVERQCPVSPPAAAFADRGDILEPHVRNVDCAVHYDIAAGFDDETFRPGWSVRRDQMASLLLRTLEAADIQLPPAEEGREFTDVAAGNPHRDSIRRLEASGIVAGGPLGRPADQYGPNLPVRRDQMASMLDHAVIIAHLGFPNQASQSAESRPAAAAVGPYPDVHPGNVHASEIQQATNWGLIAGYADGTFRPGARTRRDHMATFMTRLLHLLAVPTRVEIVEQSAETATVGEDVTFTVVVYTQYDVPVGPSVCRSPGDTFPFRHTCTVTVEADGGSPAEQTVEPDQHGRTEFVVTAEAPGPVTVTATIEDPRGLYGATGDSDSTQVIFLPPP